MQLGLYIPPFDELADPALIARLAAEAEEAGWDGVYIWDHVRWREPVLAVADPQITLAAIAGATERIRLGPMVTPLARRRPAKVARGLFAGPQVSVPLPQESERAHRRDARCGRELEADPQLDVRRLPSHSGSKRSESESRGSERGARFECATRSDSAAGRQEAIQAAADVTNIDDVGPPCDDLCGRTSSRRQRRRQTEPDGSE